MKTKTLIAAVVIILIIIIGGVVWLALPRSPQTSANIPPQNNQPSGITSVEKDAIVAAILSQQKILLSKDAAQIKTYLSKIFTTPEDKKEFNKMVNKDFLNVASAMTSGGDVTAQELTSKDAIWNVGSDIAVVRIQKQGKTVGYTVQKIGGAWY